MRHSAPPYNSLLISTLGITRSTLSTRSHQFQIQIQHPVGSSLLFLSGEQIFTPPSPNFHYVSAF
ncbi:unnamed protein product, partial [Vitis vinifera]|uniref:Uncharacterized protein n=1 Tax=Vitis vinifera TaxID=29760 RepID=E0CNQ4_VITVI